MNMLLQLPIVSACPSCFDESGRRFRMIGGNSHAAGERDVHRRLCGSVFERVEVGHAQISRENKLGTVGKEQSSNSTVLNGCK